MALAGSRFTDYELVLLDLQKGEHEQGLCRWHIRCLYWISASNTSMGLSESNDPLFQYDRIARLLMVIKGK